MHPDYVYQASVAVGCQGPQSGVVRRSPAGPRRSRDGAQLAHVLADARYWHEAVQKEVASLGECESGVGGPLTSHHVLLTNPTRHQVANAVTEGGKFLRQFRGRENWTGGTVDFYFAGHGTEDGHLVLADGEFSADELMDLIAGSAEPGQWRRRARFVFDCCYSGLMLARIIVNPLHGSRVSIPDALAAALHDELSWEMDSLGHGALTFTMANPGNAHVDQRRLAEAVQQGDESHLRLALQSFVPNPVTYLTEGDQHSLDLVNGHLLEIKGFGQVDILGEDVTLEQLLSAVDQVRSNPELGHRIELT